MTGQLGIDGLTDPAVKEALDLCLECKACKSECPTNVDMARLKAEFLDQHHKKHGVPWRNWVFGSVRLLGRLAGHAPVLSNGLSGSRFFRWLGDNLFGIDARRRAPRLARMDFYDSLDQHLAKRGLTWESIILSPTALVFLDTFTFFHEPAVGLDLFDVVSAVGRPPLFTIAGTLPNPTDRMIVCGVACCGRPYISNGMLDRAIKLARTNVDLLYRWVRTTQKPIIACEPSCILTIKDDYPALLRGEERRKAEVVAAACMTFEEFLENSFGREPPTSADSTLAGGSRLNVKPFPHKILVQPHCHQRSLVGTGALMKLLKRIPQAEVIDPDAGCCGMAGSFGYEKEHYEVSRLVGEQRLFPAIRKLGPEDIIVAPGFSCRMQIEHFTGRKAMHPAELLASLLEPP